MNRADRSLAALAASQHGVFSRAQAYAGGLDRWAVSRRCRDGLFVAVGTRTFAFAGAAVSWRGMLKAGLLDLGDDAVVCGRAATALFGLDGATEGAREFFVPRVQRHRRTLGEVHSGPELRLIDRTTIEGLAVVTATVAIIQIAANGSRAEVTNAIDSAVRSGLTSPAFLSRRLAEHRSTRMSGVALLDEVLVDAGVESWLERQFLALVKAAGLPPPATQRVYRANGRHVARVDFDFAPWPVVVEVGGRKGYLTTRERQRQERRRTELQLLGKVMYFFGFEDVALDPQYVVATLAAITARRAS